MNNSYQALQSVFTQFTRAAAAAERVFSLMDSLPDIDTGVAEGALPSSSAAVGSSSTSPRSSEVDGGAGAAASAALAATRDPLDLRTHCRGELELRNVKFFYQMRPDRVVLNDVCLHIPAGTVCALVGRSGGGKSTIVHLLQRFYDVQGGAILFDGHDIRRYDVRVLRGEIGVVAQDTPLFARTILDNIVYGLEEDSWTMPQVRDAAKQACALEFIEEFPDGFDTRVGERGLRISGGQRQRIAIARVFLRRPRVLLLDEATSALDAESESKVQDALDRLIKGVTAVDSHSGSSANSSTTGPPSTVILVAHRLSTVMNADKIAVIDNGKVVEEGTHDALVQLGGVYSTLVRTQIAKRSNLLDEDGNAASEPTIDEILAPQEAAAPEGEGSATVDDLLDAAVHASG